VVTFLETVISVCRVQKILVKIILRMRNIPEMPSSSQQRKIAESLREVLAPYSVGYRIKLLGQLGSRRFQERLEPFGLTPFHWVVLCCLWEEDGLATCSIGEKLQQVGGTLTGVLDRMEERGLIRRERDPRDRRIWRIWLTDAGRELEDILPPIALELKEQAMQGFSVEERQLFSQLIDQAIANLS
jgi:MarR family transcriptional regulator, organic hydroperoxide resistance regulator